MPQLDTTGWTIAAQERRKDPGIIDLPAQNITGRDDIDEDSLDLTQEPEFQQDPARDRGATFASLAPQIPYGPIRSLIPEEMHSKWRLFMQLEPTIPLNQYNLPTYYYRADLLDHSQIQSALLTAKAPTPVLDSAGSTTTTHQILAETRLEGLQAIGSTLDAAIVPLQYHEGFPATEGGTPFWSRLDAEPENAFDAFVYYLELGGARKRSDLKAYPVDDLNEWYHCYFWAFRVKAFELYRQVNHQKTRLHRMLQTEDSHFKRAEKLFATVANVLEGFTPEELKDVGFEKLVNSFEKLVKVQRISVGLSANGGAIEADDLKKAPTTQVLVQNIVQNTEETRRTEELEQDLLVDAPDAVEMAQELIIRTQQQNGGKL